MNAENNMLERIEKMFRNDRIFAYTLLIGVCLAVWFVVNQVAALGPPGALMGLVYLSALALCVFNTAQASQTHYMVLRNSHFGPFQVPAVFLEAKLNTLGQIMKILESA